MSETNEPVRAEEPQTQEPAPAGPEAGFIDALPEDLRGSETLADVRDAADLARRYADLAGRMKGAPRPPENPDEYDVPVTEGMQVDENMLAGFKRTAFEAGLSPDQVRALAEWHNGWVQGLSDERGRNAADVARKTEDALRKEWGPSYARNLDEARRAYHLAADEELQKFLEDSGLGDNRLLLRMFHRIGRAVGEDALAAPEPGSGSPRQTDGGMPMLHFPSLD